jgi:AcrR family transcriptional regulator
MSRTDHDSATRERLLAAGARLFAARGYAHVTIRDICAAAGANIAAVNYHFPGKAGLYDEVVRRAIASLQLPTTAVHPLEMPQRPEYRLRAYVRAAITGDSDDWAHQLVARELSEPTDSLSRIVDEVLRPQLAWLQRIVVDLLGCDQQDPRVARAAFSIHAQCLALRNTGVAVQIYPVVAEPTADAMVDHITEFSLAGLWAMARMA